MSTYWQDKQVLITGASGLVGYHLCKYLVKEKANIVALVRDMDHTSQLFRSDLYKQIIIVNGELESLQTIERAITSYDVTHVFHLGAQAIVGTANKSPLITFESNIKGTYNLLEMCRQQKKQIKSIVIASSDKAYGSAKLPYTEQTPLCGLHPYDVSKSCADLIAQSYAHTYHLPIAIARCGNIYGPGDMNWSRLIPGCIKQVLENTAPIIRSNGLCKRDYVFVEDAVSAYICLSKYADKFPGQGFNFGHNKPLSVCEVVDKILQLTNKSLKPEILDQANLEIQDQYLCCEKAKRILSWAPFYDFEEGLRQTINWYANMLNISTPLSLAAIKVK